MRARTRTAPSLESKTTVVRRLRLRLLRARTRTSSPEFAKSYEFGTELSFLDDRLGLDATVYRKQTKDQIVKNIRGSYATGFILFNLNGASTRNTGPRAHAARHAGAAQQLLVGRPGELRPARAARCSRCRTSCRSRTSPTPGSTATSATARSRASRRCRSPACSTCATSNGQLLIDPTTGLPLRSPHVHRRRLRPPARLHDRPDEQLQVRPVLAELPARLPEGRRRLQRDRALPDGARPRDEHARPRTRRASSTGVLRDGKENTRQPDAEQHRRDPGEPDRRTTRT